MNAPGPERTLLTTREAAAFCGYGNPSTIRKAQLAGKLRSRGRRGGTGPYVFHVDDLRAFMSGRRTLS
jgi:hypothetical protein